MRYYAGKALGARRATPSIITRSDEAGGLLLIPLDNQSKDYPNYDVSRLHVRILELGIAKVGMVKVCILEIRATRMDIAQIRTGKIRRAPVRFGHLSTFKDGILGVDFTAPCFAKGGTIEAAPFQIGIREIGFAEISGGEDSIAEDSVT